MRRIKKLFWFISLTGLLISSTACTNPQTKNGGKNKTQELNEADTSWKISQSKEKVLFLLPLPGEILDRFHSSDIKYAPEFLNPATNKDKYIGSKAQSLNLGVYITDMAYSALFERSAETVDYLEAIQSLSGDLGISSNIFESLLSRSKANAGIIDSLVNISNEAFTNMLEFLETGGKENTIARITAGAYIESLNIAIHSIENFSVSSKIPGLLAEMKYPMDNLLETANNINPDEKDNSLIKYIKEVSDIFQELDKSSSKTVISQQQKGVISITGGNKLSMNEAEFNKLKSSVTEIRKNMVSF